MRLEDRFEVPADVIARKVEDELVILDLASGSYFGLDPVGARIWELLRAGRQLLEICDIMCAEFDVCQEIMERDLLELVDTLQKCSLVRLRTRAAAK